MIVITSSVSLAAPISPSAWETIVILLARDRGADTSAATFGTVCKKEDRSQQMFLSPSRQRIQSVQKSEAYISMALFIYKGVQFFNLVNLFNLVKFFKLYPVKFSNCTRLQIVPSKLTRLKNLASLNLLYPLIDE